MKIILGLVCVLILAAQGYVRLAPMRAKDWHVDPFTAEAPKDIGVLERFASQMSLEDTIDALHSIAQNTPRTTVLAGTPQDGRVSYVTRSRFWGFPDTTTIGVRDAAGETEVAILARARFGTNDYDVNAQRVAAWRAVAGL